VNRDPHNRIPSESGTDSASDRSNGRPISISISIWNVLQSRFLGDNLSGNVGD